MAVPSGQMAAICVPLGAHVSEALRNKIARSELFESVDLLENGAQISQVSLDFHVVGEWSRGFS